MITQTKYCLLATVLVYGTLCLAQEPEVTISTGTLRGVKEDGLTRYLGVPYGEPPVGPLRFRAPQPHKGWSGVRDATKEGHFCPQDLTMTEQMDKEMFDLAFRGTQENIGEDCLFLNIYVPEGLEEKAPVLFWIHGGGLTVGTERLAGFTSGEVLAKTTSSIIVGVHYRLNVFGFMPIDHPDFEANVGLRDQILALKWVQENIEYFGGDKDSVTIFGQSAGAGSVMALLQTPLAKGLFHRAFPMSGALIGQFETVKEAQITGAHQLAQAANCSIGDKEELVTCLQGFSMEDLLKASAAVYSTIVIDGDYFVKQSTEVLTQGLFNKVPLLVSFCSEDGNVFAEGFTAHLRQVQKEGVDAEGIETILSFILKIGLKVPDSHMEIVKAVVKFEYDLESPDPKRVLRGLYDLCRDSQFGLWSLIFADAYSKAGIPVYVAVFDQQIRPPVEGALIDLGAAHGEELYYLFGVLYKSEGITKHWPRMPEVTDKDKALTDLMMKMLGDFIRGNKIEMKWKDEDVELPAYKPEEKNYVMLNTNFSKDSIKQNPYTRAVSFWNDLIPSLRNMESCTPQETEKQAEHADNANGEQSQDVKDEL